MTAFIILFGSVLILIVAAVVYIKVDDKKYLATQAKKAGEYLGLKEEEQQTPEWKKGDSITTTPIDNPLDFRDDGSIRKGDPGWEIVEAAMQGAVVSGSQNRDGTWTINTEGDQQKVKKLLEDPITMPCGRKSPAGVKCALPRGHVGKGQPAHDWTAV